MKDNQNAFKHYKNCCPVLLILPWCLFLDKYHNIGMFFVLRCFPMKPLFVHFDKTPHTNLLEKKFSDNFTNMSIKISNSFRSEVYSQSSNTFRMVVSTVSDKVASCQAQASSTHRINCVSKFHKHLVTSEIDNIEFREYLSSLFIALKKSFLSMVFNLSIKSKS